MGGEDTEEYILRLGLDQANEWVSLTPRETTRELILVRMARLRSALFPNSGRQHARPRVSHVYIEEDLLC
jgi:hypothetical protein